MAKSRFYWRTKSPTMWQFCCRTDGRDHWLAEVEQHTPHQFIAIMPESYTGYSYHEAATKDNAMGHVEGVLRDYGLRLAGDIEAIWAARRPKRAGSRR